MAKVKLNLIGMGPGNPDLLTGAARAALAESTILLGDRRLLSAFPMEGKDVRPTTKPSDIRAVIEAAAPGTVVAVLVSGDVGFYSLAKSLTHVENCEVHRYAGISSLVYFAAALEIPWEDACIVSRHGRNQPLIPAVRQHKKVFFLTGGKHTVASVCAELTAQGLGDLDVAVGERLSYDNERIVRAKAGELTDASFSTLSSLFIFNPQAETIHTPVHGLADGAFVRSHVPMTRQEVRAVAIAKLRPQVGDTMYDVGAGTGSCSVELALQAPLGQVYALEEKDTALELLASQKERFNLPNMTIVAGNAAATIPALPAPDCVFIGGTKGELPAILDGIYAKNKACRVVLTAIALETVSAIVTYYAAHTAYDLDIVQLAAARGRHVGTYHMLTAENPIFILTASLKE